MKSKQVYWVWVLAILGGALWGATMVIQLNHTFGYLCNTEAQNAKP